MSLRCRHTIHGARWTSLLAGSPPNQFAPNNEHEADGTDNDDISRFSRGALTFRRHRMPEVLDRRLRPGGEGLHDDAAVRAVPESSAGLLTGRALVNQWGQTLIDSLETCQSNRV